MTYGSRVGRRSRGYCCLPECESATVVRDIFVIRRNAGARVRARPGNTERSLRGACWECGNGRHRWRDVERVCPGGRADRSVAVEDNRGHVGKSRACRLAGERHGGEEHATLALNPIAVRGKEADRRIAGS